MSRCATPTTASRVSAVCLQRARPGAGQAGHTPCMLQANRQVHSHDGCISHHPGPAGTLQHLAAFSPAPLQPVTSPPPSQPLQRPRWACWGSTPGSTPCPRQAASTASAVELVAFVWHAWQWVVSACTGGTGLPGSVHWCRLTCGSASHANGRALARTTPSCHPAFRCLSCRSPCRANCRALACTTRSTPTPTAACLATTGRRTLETWRT